MEKNKNLITIIVVLVVLIVLGFLAWWYLQQRGQNIMPQINNEGSLQPNPSGEVPPVLPIPGPESNINPENTNTPEPTTNAPAPVGE